MLSRTFFPSQRLCYCSGEPQNDIYQGTSECLQLLFWTSVSSSISWGGRWDQMASGVSPWSWFLCLSSRHRPQLGLSTPGCEGGQIPGARGREQHCQPTKAQGNTGGIFSRFDLFWTEGNIPSGLPSRLTQDSGSRWKLQGRSKTPNLGTKCNKISMYVPHYPSYRDFSALYSGYDLVPADPTFPLPNWVLFGKSLNLTEHQFP